MTGRLPARGFTYLGLLILLAVLGLVGAAGLKMGTLMQRAAAEEELLEIGAQFQDALRSYAAATPPGQKTQPATLHDLLRDPRFPSPRRHLRKIFVDPVTGSAEWGIIYLGDQVELNPNPAGGAAVPGARNPFGATPAPTPTPSPLARPGQSSQGEKVGVIGVYSLSERRPLKIANFDIRFQHLENREKLSDWKFVLLGADSANPAVNTAENSMTGAAPPTSLFQQPGTGEAGGAKAADPAASGGKGAPPPVPGPGQPADKPVEPPLAAPQESDEPVRTDEAQPVQSDDEKAAEAEDKEKDKDKDKDKDKENDKDGGKESDRQQEQGKEQGKEQVDNSTSSTTKSLPPEGTTPPPENRGVRKR